MLGTTARSRLISKVRTVVVAPPGACSTANSNGTTWCRSSTIEANVRLSPVAMLIGPVASDWARSAMRSEEHTSELQSRQYLVCRLLLEKKKKRQKLDPKINRLI